MPGDQFQKHLEEMHRFEGVFWDTGVEDDEIRKRLQDIQTSLEAVTAPCFQEPMRLYSILTKPWRSRDKQGDGTAGWDRAVAQRFKSAWHKLRHAGR